MPSTHRFDLFMSELLHRLRMDFGLHGLKDVVWIEYEVRVINKERMPKLNFPIRLQYVDRW